MNGIKGFSILVLLFSMLAFIFLSVGQTEEMTDEQFKKEYEKTLIAELDYPLGDKMPAQIKLENQDDLLWDIVINPWLMSDIHRNRFNIMFSYREELSTLLKIKKVEVNNREVVFIQTDGIIPSDNTKSFVVIDLAKSIMDKGDILITVYFNEDNKLGFKKRYMVIKNSDINSIIKLIEKEYQEFQESETQL